MNLKFICFSFPFLVLFASLREYNKALRSTDMALKYETAKKYFDDKKYNQTIALLEEAKPLMQSTLYAEESLYLLAQSYYKKKDYTFASRYFKNYYTSFPKGEYTESARFHSVYSLYLKSPDVRFDQSDTYKAIWQLQEFLEHYPYSKKKEIVKYALSELQERLVLKELMAVRLYYNLENYTLYSSLSGNSYLSCIITAQNALQSYPFSKYREDFVYYIFMAKYKMALQNIKEKKDFQYHYIINEYYSYIKEYPSGKYLKKIQKLYNSIVKLKDYES